MRRVVFVSSTAVYGVPDKHPIEEDDLLHGVGHYGESKIEAEDAVRAFMRRGLDCVILRPKTFIGLSGWASSRSSSTGSATGAGSTRWATAPTGTSCSPSRISSRRSCSASKRTAAWETLNVGAKEFETVREDLQALIDHATSKSRLTPIPVRAAEVAPRARARARLAARRMALQDSPSRLVRRHLARGEGPRLEAEALECRSADPHLRLVPGPSRRGHRRGRSHPPRPVEPAGARAAEEGRPVPLHPIHACFWPAITLRQSDPPPRQGC